MVKGQFRSSSSAQLGPVEASSRQLRSPRFLPVDQGGAPMSHHPLHAHASTSALPGGSPPGPNPQRVPAEHSEHTEATSRTPGACAPPPATGPGFADAAGLTRERAAGPATSAVHLAGVPDGREGELAGPGAAALVEGANENPSLPGPGQHHTLRSWPLLILALPAAVAVWSGWVGIGQMTGFGLVHPLPGIWDSLHLNSSIPLPVGVEAYAAYALRAWLSASAVVSARTRRFARWSAIGSLLLGMAGQIAYHLLTQAHTARAPWGI